MDENELLIDLTYRAGQIPKKKREASDYAEDAETVFDLYKRGIPGAVELVLANMDIFLENGAKPENRYNKIKDLYITGSNAKKARAIIEKETEDNLRTKVLPYCTFSILKDFRLALKDTDDNERITDGKREAVEDAYKQANDEKKENDRFVNKAAEEAESDETDEYTDDETEVTQETSPEEENFDSEIETEEEIAEETAEETEEETSEEDLEEAAPEETEDYGTEETSDEEAYDSEVADEYDEYEGLSEEELIDALIRKGDSRAILAIGHERGFGGYEKVKVKDFLRYCLYHADFKDRAYIEDVLHTIGELEGNVLWLCEYSFWQSLRPELFELVTRYIAANYEFFEIAYVNMQVAKAHGDNPLLLKWMEMYVKIGLGSGDNGEEFQKNYKRIQRDGALGERSISLLNALIFDQALAYKRLFESEHDKCVNVEDKVYIRISNNISEQLARIEEFLAGDYQNVMEPNEYKKNVVSMFASLRRGMDKCGLNYVISPTDWSGGDEVEFEKGNHIEFNNEAQNGDMVVPLTTGISVNNGTYVQPAKVMKKS